MSAVWSRGTASDLLAVFSAWALLLLCMALASLMNYKLGFAVWPLGEDRVWIEILQRPNPIAAAKAFWQINDRNPLAPWWYIGLRPIILNWHAGLLLIREVVGLLLAAATYIFLFVTTRTRAFSLGVACVIAVFLANGYIDQIYWTMQLALVFSLCSLVLYQLSLDSREAKGWLYGGAIAAWFIALGTYSIQTGAILAVAFLGFTAPATTMLTRLRRAAADTLPFALIFVVFWLEWQTTSRDLYVGRPHLRAAILSIFQAFWHFDYLAFFNGVAYVDLRHRLLFLAIALAVGALVFFALGRHRGERALPFPWWRLLQAVIAVGCLMLPVIAVEASGYGIIGEAWRKVYQLTIPLLYLSMAAAVIAFLPPKVEQVSWRIAASLLTMMAAAVTLGINRVQVEVTHNEKLLLSSLTRLAKENAAYGYAPPYYFLIRREPSFLWYSSDFLSALYGRTGELAPSTSFRFIPDVSSSDLRFFLRYTETGVENAALDGKAVGNDHVFLLLATKEGIRRLCDVGPDDMKSPLVEWHRSTAITSKISDCASSHRDR